MLNPHGDLGAALFKTWSEEQKRAEIAKLVQGFRAGVPVGILCHMTETIAGSRAAAKACLAEMLSPEERRQAVETTSGGLQQLVREYLLD